MRQVEVTLSDGQPLAVRRLGLFELDNVAPEKKDPGPFFYPVELAGGTIQNVIYDISAVTDPPKKPKKGRDQIQRRKDGLWFEWYEYDLYQAAVAHERTRIELARERLHAMARYIMNTCINPAETDRVETQEDWNRVQAAAVAPQVTMHDIEAALTNTFGATWRDRPIIEALGDLPEFGGKMDSIRQWEITLMMKLGKSEEDYGMIAIPERARMIVADKVSGWMEALSSHEQMQQAKSKMKAKK